MPSTFSVAHHPKQRRFMESTAPLLMYSGAFAAGKSRVGCEKGLFLSMAFDNNVGAIVRKNFAHLRDTTMRVFFRDVIPEEILARSDFNKNTGWLTLPNGSQILFGGIDQPGKFASGEYSWIFVDESIELDEPDFVMLQGRLRLPTVPFRQLFMATNPGPVNHWLYKLFYEEKAGELVESNTLENIHLPEDYFERVKTFKGPYYERFVEGKWMGFEGLVYDNFDPINHIVEPFTIPWYWQRYRAIDFGYTNPFVCQWWARKPKESNIKDEYRPFYRYKEIYWSQRTVEEHAKIILSESGAERYPATFADWDAESRRVLENNGIPTTMANKAISAGIQEVYHRIAANEVLFFPDSYALVGGRDPVLVEKNYSASTIEEFPNYRWIIPRGDVLQKEEPIDMYNDGMDSMRYMLFTLSDQSKTVFKPPKKKAGLWKPGRIRDIAGIGRGKWHSVG